MLSLQDKLQYRISGVMVNVLVSSAIDRGFEPRSSQIKDYKIGICCFSTKHTALTRYEYAMHVTEVPLMVLLFGVTTLFLSSINILL
jgi:hypothetical protein